MQEITTVAKTVDLESQGREPVFDPPAILAERINFDRAVRVQHTEQILHGIGHGSLLLCLPQTPSVGLATAFSGVLAGTRSDSWCLVERSGFGVRCRQAAIIFSFVIGIASRKVCIGVLPKHQRP